MIRIVHIINNLETGGAEMTLFRLLKETDREKFEPLVISLVGMGTLGHQIRDMGIEVVVLGATRRRIELGTLFRLRRELKRFKPQVIQSWMYHSNLAAMLARLLMPARVPLAWNIRHSLHDISFEPWMTRQVIRVGAQTARWAQSIVSNSATSIEQHEAIGYRSSRFQLIANGIDPEEVHRVPGASLQLRGELGVDQDTFLVGSAARWHPMKDQAMLAKAVAMTDPRVHLVLCGPGCEPGGKAEILREHLPGRLHLLGERRPLSKVLSGLDCFAVSSKWGEAFPNVLAEAMACQVPCITTDIGDAAVILGDPSRVIRPEDFKAMSNALSALLDLPAEDRVLLGSTNRERIVQNYQLADMVDRYEALWESLAAAM